MFYSAEKGVGAVLLANGELGANELPAMERLLVQLFFQGAKVKTCE
jgi:hypothetical protein